MRRLHRGSRLRPHSINRNAPGENRYVALFEGSRDGLALFDVRCDDSGRAIACRCTAVNLALERLLGVSADEAVGRDMRGLIPGIDSAIVTRCLLAACGRSGGDLDEVWCDRAHSLAVRVYSPAPRQLVAVFSDVTEQLHTEDALRVSESRLRMAQAITSIATWEWNLRTGQHRWSDNMWQMSHLDPSAHVPSQYAWLASVAPLERERIERELNEAVGRNLPFSIEYRLNTHDGSERWLTARGGPLLDADGHATHYIGVVIDASEERRIRNHLNWTRRKLDEAHRIAGISVWDWTVESDSVTWSEGLYHLLGLDPSGQPPLPAVYPPESWSTLQALMTEALATGRPFDVELPMVRTDGSICWTRVVGSAQADEDGRVIGLHGIVHDISERMRAQEELERYRQRLSALTVELARSDERVRRQAALELHDGVGQELAATKMLVQQLSAHCGHGDPSLVKRLLDLVDQSIAGVRGLTNELSPPVLYELGLGPALSWLAESYENRMGLRVGLHLCRLEGVKGEGSDMAFRVARELLMNVHRHAGVHEARLHAALLDDVLVVRVKDDGCGFDAALAGATGGERFGLFSIREQVHLVGGTVEIDSTPGVGTTVDVRIPVNLGDDAVWTEHGLEMNRALSSET